ncbi:TPA: hypothetical protein ACH3X3_005155 [Trebouxia sp. C0006]
MLTVLLSVILSIKFVSAQSLLNSANVSHALQQDSQLHQWNHWLNHRRSMAASPTSATVSGGACQYVFVEYIGSSGAAITADDIARFPKPPSNVKLSWVVAFVADAGPSAAPTGEFVCTSGSLCSGSKLDSVLLSSLKSVAGAEVYAGLGGPLYPSWPTTSAPGYAATAAQSLIAFAKANLLAGYDLNFQAGLNDDWVKQWTSIVGTLTVLCSNCRQA